MSEERSIQDYLDDILNAVYGEEVRESIVGAITKCYEDGSAGSVDVIARGRLDVVEPIAENAQETANTNIWATLQVEKKMTQEGVHDLNACVETGKYYADTTSVASIVTNQPSSKTASTVFAVLVLQQESTSAIIQMLIDSTRMIWVRRGTKSGSTWTFGAWLRFLSNDDLTTINTALGTKANKNNAELTGAPVATTANDNDNSTRIATTAYVMREANKRATKANPTLSNPTLTGTAVAPTPAASSNNTTIATTQYVTRAISNFKGAFDTAMSNTSVNAVQNKVVHAALAAKADLASPPLTGNPTAPTQTTGNNSTRIATTAFVKNSIDAIPDAAYNVGRGLIKGVDMMYLDYTKPHLGRVPTYAGLTIASSSRVIIWSDDNKDLRSSASGYAMVTVQINADVTQAISANSAFLTLPVPVGTPCFGIVVRGQTGVIPAYINGNGAVVPTQAIAAEKRIYITLTYCTSDARNWR